MQHIARGRGGGQVGTLDDEAYGGRAGQVLVDDVLARGRDEDVGVGGEDGVGVDRTAVLPHAVVAVGGTQLRQPGDVKALGVEHGTPGGGRGDHDGPQLGQPVRGGQTDGAEALECDARAGEGQPDALRGGVGGLGDAVARDTQLVVGQATERARQTDDGAAVAQLVHEDRRVGLGEAHVEAEDVLAGHLVGQGAGEGTQDALLVRGVRVAEDARLRSAVEEVDRGPLPGHGPGQPRDFQHAQAGAHPCAALAHATGGVVEDQDSPHPGPAVGDADHLLRAPFVHEVESVVRQGCTLLRRFGEAFHDCRAVPAGTEDPAHGCRR